MSYTPTNWSTGDTITASALNKIEQGIAGGGGGAVIIEDNGTQLDKTFAEIYELIHSGTPCYISYTHSGSPSLSDLDTEFAYFVSLMPVLAVKKYDDMYRVYASASRSQYVSNTNYVGGAAVWAYQANSSSDYPTFFRTTYAANTSSSTEYARIV